MRADHPDRAWTSGCDLMVMVYAEEGFSPDTIAEHLLSRRKCAIMRKIKEVFPRPLEITKRFGVFPRHNRGAGRVELLKGFSTREEAEEYVAQAREPRKYFRIIEI